MSRQRLTWLVIGVVFAALLVLRGMTGQGLGRGDHHRVLASEHGGKGTRAGQSHEPEDIPDCIVDAPQLLSGELPDLPAQPRDISSLEVLDQHGCLEPQDTDPRSVGLLGRTRGCRGNEDRRRRQQMGRLQNHAEPLARLLVPDPAAVNELMDVTTDHRWSP